MKVDMKFSSIKPYLRNLSSLAQEAAIEAGEYIQSQLDLNLQVKYKKGMGSLASSVVTEVDCIAQTLILKKLSQASEFADGLEFGLLAEESDDNHSRLNCEYFWAVDPLDGTLAFTQGTPGYSVCIALIHHSGEVVMGVVYDPREAVTYHAIIALGASQLQSARQQTCLYVKPRQPKKNLRVLFDISQTEVEGFTSRWENFVTIAQNAGYEQVRFMTQGGAAMKCMNILREAINPSRSEALVYFKEPKATLGGGAIWDFAAASLILKEAHLYQSSFEGKALHFNQAHSIYMNEQGVCFASEAELYPLCQQF